MFDTFMTTANRDAADACSAALWPSCVLATTASTADIAWGFVRCSGSVCA